MLFISSYVPLYILLIIKNILERCTDEGRITITFRQILTAHYFNEVNDYAIAMLFSLSIFSLIFLKYLTKKSGDTHFYKIQTVADETGNVYFNYISVYLLSCLGLSLNNIVDVFVLFFLMLLVGFIYVNNSMTYMNPVMQFMGYKVYECEVYSLSTQSIFSSVVIAKKDILIKAEQKYKGSSKQDFIYVDSIIE